MFLRNYLIKVNKDFQQKYGGNSAHKTGEKVMLVLILVTFVATLLASLLGMGIKAAMNSGKPKPNQFAATAFNQTVLYQFPNNGGSNNLPMYLSKNNQQSGPIPAEQVLNLLNSGQVSPFDMAIKQGDTQWQPLSMYFAVKQTY